MKRCNGGKRGTYRCSRTVGEPLGALRLRHKAVQGRGQARGEVLAEGLGVALELPQAPCALSTLITAACTLVVYILLLSREILGQKWVGGPQGELQRPQFFAESAGGPPTLQGTGPPARGWLYNSVSPVPRPISLPCFCPVASVPHPAPPPVHSPAADDHAWQDRSPPSGPGPVRLGRACQRIHWRSGQCGAR